MLDLPALVFPVTKVNPEKDLADPNFNPLSEEDEKFRGDCESRFRVVSGSGSSSAQHANHCESRPTDDPQLTANVPAAGPRLGLRVGGGGGDEELLGLGEIVAGLCGSKNWKQQ